MAGENAARRVLERAKRMTLSAALRHERDAEPFTADALRDLAEEIGTIPTNGN